MDKGIYCLVLKNPGLHGAGGGSRPCFVCGRLALLHRFSPRSRGPGAARAPLPPRGAPGQAPEMAYRLPAHGSPFRVAYAVSAPSTGRLECLLASALAPGGTAVDSSGAATATARPISCTGAGTRRTRLSRLFPASGSLPGSKPSLPQKGRVTYESSRVVGQHAKEGNTAQLIQVILRQCKEAGIKTEFVSLAGKRSSRAWVA